MIEFKLNNLINTNRNILKNNLRLVSFAGHSSEYDSYNSYIKNVISYPRIDREEERKLAAKIKLGGEKAKKAREDLMLANLRFVVDRVKKRKNKRLPLMDLIQEGNRGLYRATKDYNGEYAFVTYAANWIDNYLQKAERKQSRIIRLPEDVEARIETMKKTVNNLTGKLCRKPTIQEISEDMNIPAEKVQDLVVYSQKINSLDKHISDADENETLYTLVKDKNAQNPSDYADRKILEIEIEKLLKSLSVQQKEAIILHYGLFGNTPLTKTEIAEKLNVSRQAIDIRINNALKKLKIKSAYLKKEFEDN